jgi:hypothetical protein
MINSEMKPAHAMSTYHPNGTLSIYNDISKFRFCKAEAILSAKRKRIPLKEPTSSGGWDLEYANSHYGSCEMRRSRRMCVYMLGVQLVPPRRRGPS